MSERLRLDRVLALLEALLALLAREAREAEDDERDRRSDLEIERLPPRLVAWMALAGAGIVKNSKKAVEAIEKASSRVGVAGEAALSSRAFIRVR